MKRILVRIATILIVVIIGVVIAARYYLHSGPYVQDQCTPSDVYDLRGFAAQLDNYLKSYYDAKYPYDPQDIRGHFSIMPGGTTDLYGSADAVYILWITDQLEERTTAEGRAEWIAVLQSFQDPDTGLFDREIVSGESVTHATAFATAALRLLDAQPKYPHRWAEKLFRDRAAIDAWLDEFSWTEVWTGSHETGAMAAVIDSPTGVSISDGWEHQVLAAFTSRIDESTGFWKNGLFDAIFTSPTTVDLGGAAHFWWLYDRLDRPIPYPEKAITGIIELQRDTGLWGARIFNGAIPQGIDFDAVNGLRLALKAVSEDHRNAVKADIVATLDRYACVVDHHLARDGSMAELYPKIHKIVGTLNTIAEVNILYRQLTGRDRFILDRPWRSALTEVSWQ